MTRELRRLSPDEAFCLLGSFVTNRHDPEASAASTPVLDAIMFRGRAFSRASGTGFAPLKLARSEVWARYARPASVSR